MYIYLNWMDILVVQIRQNMFPISLLRTPALFIKEHQYFVVGKQSNWMKCFDLWCNYTTLWCKRTTNCSSLLISVVKSVSRHEEASAGGGSFAWQPGLNALQNLEICFSWSTCPAINKNLPSVWFYQDHMWP